MRIHSVHHLIDYRHSISTKPFNARGSKVVRCRRCQIETNYCICDYQPDVRTNVSALILMSDSEVMKPSNTGRLIADVIKDTYVFQWHRTEPQDELLDLLASPKYMPVVVFPQEYVIEQRQIISKVQDMELSGKRLLFVFIDSNWREAKKIFRKSPYLSAFPVLSVNPDELSQYMMRKSENENHLSTAEVASIVLGLANEDNAANTLKLWFEVFRESYLISKTRFQSDLTRPSLSRYLDTTP